MKAWAEKRKQEIEGPREKEPADVLRSVVRIWELEEQLSCARYVELLVRMRS
jgi:hypothetical protein